jgi:hypothetical protein
MIKNAVGYIVSAIASLQTKRDNPHRDIFGRVIEHGEEFFHPQTFKGIPVFDTESIMRHYKPLLDKLAIYTDIGDHRKTPDGKQNLFDALYTDVIRRYVEYAHMIPASEDHHHSHTGGLIVHSLEVSIAALRYAKEIEIPKTGFSDTDHLLRPIMHYCAWLAGLLHDAGKIMIDVSVDAAEIIHPLTKRPTPMTTPIPSWRPQKESLTEWALRYKVASYSVSFYNDRKHKRHNVDAAQILKPILSNSYALDYILSSPLQNETYSELCRILSGWSKSKDYLSSAVRHGDADSTGRNVGIEYDRVRGNRALSTASRIYQAIRNARKEWDWNIQNAEGWVIGGDVYLRWTSAIDSIAKVAKEMQHALPTDARNLLTIMESNGLVQMYDKSNRMIKFSPGGYKPEDIPLISSGKKNVQWMDLFKMRGREMVFGTDPMPDSVSGLIFLSESSTFIIIDKEGIATEFKGDTGEVAQTANTLPPAANRGTDTPVIPADIPVHNVVKTTQPAKKVKNAQPEIESPAAVAPTTPTKQKPQADLEVDTQIETLAPKAKTLELLPTQHEISNIDAMNMMLADQPFPASPQNEITTTPQNIENAKAVSSSLEPSANKNPSAGKPNGKKPTAPKHAKKPEISAAQVVVPETQNSAAERATPAVVTNKPKRCSLLLSELLDKRVRYHVVGTKVLIDAEDAEAKTQLTLKEIISDLEIFGHTAINLQNPNQKTEIVTCKLEKKKAIPMAPGLVTFFKYEADIPSQKENTEVAPDSGMEITMATPTSGKDEATNVPANASGKENTAEQNTKRNSGKTSRSKKDTTSTLRFNSKNDSPATSATKSQQESTPKQQPISGLENAATRTALRAEDVIELISLSDARSFVLSGHAHVDIDALVKHSKLSIDELLLALHAANVIAIEIGKSALESIHERLHEGVAYRTVMLRREFTHLFSKHVHVEKIEPETTSSIEENPDCSYSMDMLIENTKPGSLLRYLLNLQPNDATFFIAGADHVKVNTREIIGELNVRGDLPFTLSRFKKAVRNHSVGDELINGASYTLIPNEVILTLSTSEI